MVDPRGLEEGTHEGPVSPRAQSGAGAGPSASGARQAAGGRRANFREARKAKKTVRRLRPSEMLDADAKLWTGANVLLCWFWWPFLTIIGFCKAMGTVPLLILVLVPYSLVVSWLESYRMMVLVMGTLYHSELIGILVKILLLVVLPVPCIMFPFLSVAAAVLAAFLFGCLRPWIGAYQGACVVGGKGFRTTLQLECSPLVFTKGVATAFYETLFTIDDLRFQFRVGLGKRLEALKKPLPHDEVPWDINPITFVLALVVALVNSVAFGPLMLMDGLVRAPAMMVRGSYHVLLPYKGVYQGCMSEETAADAFLHYAPFALFYVPVGAVGLVMVVLGIAVLQLGICVYGITVLPVLCALDIYLDTDWTSGIACSLSEVILVDRSMSAFIYNVSTDDLDRTFLEYLLTCSCLASTAEKVKDGRQRFSAPLGFNLDKDGNVKGDSGPVSVSSADHIMDFRPQFQPNLAPDLRSSESAVYCDWQDPDLAVRSDEAIGPGEMRFVEGVHLSTMEELYEPGNWVPVWLANVGFAELMAQNGWIRRVDEEGQISSDYNFVIRVIQDTIVMIQFIAEALSLCGRETLGYGVEGAVAQTRSAGGGVGASERRKSQSPTPGSALAVAHSPRGIVEAGEGGGVDSDGGSDVGDFAVRLPASMAQAPARTDSDDEDGTV